MSKIIFIYILTLCKSPVGIISQREKEIIVWPVKAIPSLYTKYKDLTPSVIYIPLDNLLEGNCL